MGTWFASRLRGQADYRARDAETGLDYFGARYFSGAQARFTSSDWPPTPQPVPYANLADPQTLNLYSYVRNNPLSKADPDGHCGLIGDQPCSLSEFIASVPDRFAGGLKFEANTILEMVGVSPRFTPSNAEQANAMAAGEEIKPAFQTGLAMAVPGPGKAEVGAVEGEAIGEAVSARAAQREAMRQEGIPTSQQPTSQQSTPAGRQYTYEVPKPGGGTETKIVKRNSGTDSSHPGQPHVEAGSPKPGGQADSIGRPRLQNDKVKVNVKKSDE